MPEKLQFVVTSVAVVKNVGFWGFFWVKCFKLVDRRDACSLK